MTEAPAVETDETSVVPDTGGAGAEDAASDDAALAPSAPGENGAGEAATDGTAADGTAADDPARDGAVADVASGFQVHLEVFDGPFDLLLGLIAKHKLDVTTVALSKVTDDFIAHIRALGPEWDLEQTTSFLVIAATLLDLKAARLLPAAEVEDEEDLALLEARDLLFARLLQYRAYKQVAAVFGTRLADEGRRVPRTVSLEPQFANLLPEVLLGITPEQLAQLAVRAMTPKPVPTVSIEHIHAPAVSVREQAAVIVERLRRIRSTTFRALVADADGTLVVVARFLALLELFREAAVAFDQVTPLGELSIRWTGSDDGGVDVTDEFDESDGAPEEAPRESAADAETSPTTTSGTTGSTTSEEKQ